MTNIGRGLVTIDHDGPTRPFVAVYPLVAGAIDAAALETGEVLWSETPWVVVPVYTNLADGRIESGVSFRTGPLVPLPPVEIARVELYVTHRPSHRDVATCTVGAIITTN